MEQEQDQVLTLVQEQVLRQVLEQVLKLEQELEPRQVMVLTSKLATDRLMVKAQIVSQAIIALMQPLGTATIKSIHMAK